jgi:hypothetical protein
MEGPIHHLFDKRVQKPVVYRVDDLGEDVTMQEILTYKVGKCHLRFDKPSTTSIFLSSSDKELKKAKEIYNSLILPKITKRERFDLSKEDTVVLYDYLEHIQSAIVMAFTAVECLANELVPQGFVFHQKLKGGEVKEWQRKDIERWMSTIDKIVLVIPSALSITNPTTYNFWPKFTKLKDLRNDVIHSTCVLPVDVEENERIFSLLLNESVFGKIKSVSELINKIHAELPPHQVMPILKETETINPINIPTWDSLGVTRVD